METLSRLFERLRSDAYEPVALVVELLLIGLSINWCAGVLQGTRGTRPLKGLLTVLVVATLAVRVLSAQLDWARLELLYRYFLLGMAFVALIAFQPELRRAVIRAGDVSFLRRPRSPSKLIASLVKSAGHLSQNRQGALIAIQRDVDLRGWAENGTIINAEVSANLLNSIFFPNSPLHDLGVIIRDSRVLAANCQFPLADGDELNTPLGSRHLAALGMSYESDALVLAISEETGTISLADNGHLTRFLSLDDLTSELTTRLARGRDAASPARTLTRLSGVAGRALIVVPLTLIIWYLADQATQIQADSIPLELVVTPNPKVAIDVVEPVDRIFTVSFRGSTRTIETLRARGAHQPLKVDWTVPDTYSSPSDSTPRNGQRQYSLDVADVVEHLPAIAPLGATVVKALPATMTIVVDELATVNLPVRLPEGTMRLSDVTITPSEVQVTLRRSELERVADDKRFIEARLEKRLESALPGRQIMLERIALDRTIGGFRAVRIEPTDVNIDLRVVEQRSRRTISGVVAQLLAGPQLWQRYEVVLSDPNELRLELEVEGDRSAVDGLRAQDVRAFVPVTSELVTTAPEFRSPEIVVLLPPGVTIVGPPRTVQLRLQERATAAP